MAATDLQTRKIDLASRAIDLTMALMHATTSSSSMIKGAWEIGQWLGRERLNQHELLDCMSKAKGLVFPNRNGQKFFDAIIEGIDAMPVGPLFLQQSGSLGRLMAGDPNLSWMISTVACLFQHHRDDRVVTDILTAFILKAHQPLTQGQPLSAVDSFIYNTEQTRLKAVVRKIVSSVWFNVVNVGCDTITLPQELLSVCEKGHYLDAEDFSIVTNTICSLPPSKAILRTDHLLRDVLLWFLLHYDGILVVTVAGQVVYKSDMGNPTRELEVHVASACHQDDDCHGSGAETYKILHNISGSFEHFLSGHSFPSSEERPRPGIRQKLYDIPRLHSPESPLFNRGIQILIKSTAQVMVRWLMKVPLFSQEDFTSPGFTAKPGAPTHEGQLTVSSILSRVPAIINLLWGSASISQVVFSDLSSQPQWEEYHSRSSSRKELPEWEYLAHFPILCDLIRKVIPDCMCGSCSPSNYSVPQSLKPGCLASSALNEVLLLLSHSIADGFGVNNVSSIADINPIVEGVTVLLSELVMERRICWDTWFGVAASVFLGCPFERPLPPTHPSFGGTSFVAIQYGNLAAQAPWLDLSRKLTVYGCFELIQCKGRLGVVTKSRENEQYTEFRGVEENFAIIETENTEDNSAFCSRNKKLATVVDHRLMLEHDQAAVDTDVILFPVDNKFYRLLLRVRTESHWRIVDPSDAFSGTIRLLPSSKCQHMDNMPEIDPVPAKIYSMDEVLGRWPDTVQSYFPTSNLESFSTQPEDIVHLTHVLDTHLKKNIAVALSVCTTAVLNYVEGCCHACTVERAKKAQRKPLRDNEGGNVADRYIVNFKSELMERGSPSSHRLIQFPTGEDLK
jgi:hypothetical protein